MKRCPHCGETKPLSTFSRNRAQLDGVQPWCKPCHAGANRRWRAANPERTRELGRRWEAANKAHSAATRRARHAANPEKARASRKRWYHKNREVTRRINRAKNLKRYGLSDAEYHRLLEAQGGVCAICACPPKKRRLSVDHCHSADTVRGLLCDGCNIGLGCFQDSPDRLRAAVTYLERSFDRSPVE